MLPPGLETPAQVKQYYDNLYNILTGPNGSYHPFVYPWFTIHFGIVIIYLLLDHRRSSALQALRFPIFGFLLAYTTWVITTNRARSAAAAYGTGLVSAWGTLWIATIMVFNDCQRDFKRIQYRNSVGMGALRAPVENEDRNGQALPDREQSKISTKKSVTDAQQSQNKADTGPIIWQSYPTNQQPFLERVDWIIDIFTNFRGIGWNFQIGDIPPPPAWVEAELSSASDKSTSGTSADRISSVPEISMSRTGIKRFTSRAQLFRYVAVRLTIGYFVLDLVKLLMHLDPYFWGYTRPAAPAPSYLPTIFHSSPVLLQSYRLLIGLAAIYSALNQILRMGPLLFSCILGPKYLGVRGEAWMNIPDFYGSLQPILDRGLAGWWSGYWHQTFRYAFSAPAQRLFEATGISAKSDAGKIVGSFVAFGLSAMLHFIGSYTQLGETRPFLGPARFFLLQPIGIFAQVYFIRLMRAAGLASYVPRWLGQVTNFVATHVWLYWTAPLLVEDFAEGGVWLYEPVPVSLFRGLGWGAPGDELNWWCLYSGGAFWRQGRGWLDTGLAF